MIDSAALLKDLKAQLKLLVTDLKARAKDCGDEWGARLKEEYAEAFRRKRTGHSWVMWRDSEVDQAAVAWIIATTFLRFCEDNDLLVGAHVDGRPTAIGWIAGPGDRTARAEENRTAYIPTHLDHNRRDWLHVGLSVLAAQPAGKALVDPQHNPVWTALISAESAANLIDFWRRTDDAGDLVHDFTDPDLGTRFLGDLYQDLSEHAKKTFALLQTPEFVEEFILEQTLTPALKEFGHEGLKLIDPTCGSGHFLLGAFHRLVEVWKEEAPNLDARERVRKAMDSIHGVDLNPFAVAIARFRLTVAGLKATGEHSLVAVAPFGYHLAIGDSLLGESGGVPAMLPEVKDGEEPEYKPTYLYDTEDLADYVGILQPGRYHVVVGNPPYITVKDPTLSKLYRRFYRTAYREYQLTAPFMELFFRLAIRGERLQRAGYVGKITGNGFAKQEFGRRLVEDFMGGFDDGNPADLTLIIDTSGVHIPGHGTPTVIMIGRRRRPDDSSVEAVVGHRAEPGVPVDPSRGRAWIEVLEALERDDYRGVYVSAAKLSRSDLATFPWTFAGLVEAELLDAMDVRSEKSLVDVVEVFGYTGQTNSDGAFLAPMEAMERKGVEEAVRRDFLTGKDVRDYLARSTVSAIFPYAGSQLVEIENYPGLLKWMWPLRTSTWSRATFTKATYREDGRTWWEWHQVSPSRIGKWAITYPRVVSNQHFALVRSGPVFNREASFIQLGAGATEEDYLGLLSLLNCSTASFWLKQVCKPKSGSGIGRGVQDEEWENRYEFTGAKLERFPLSSTLPIEFGRRLDNLVHDLEKVAPRPLLAAWLAENAASLEQALKQSEATWGQVRERMIFQQEELDWEVYKLYGLIDEPYTYEGDAIDQLALGQRTFEIVLARAEEAGEETAWFTRHGSAAITEIPAEWPADYAALVQRRLDLIESDPNIRLLEKPEYKRRWSVTLWAEQLTEALESAILDRLEQLELWRDEQGPIARSVSELADLVRTDEVLRELAAVLTGNPEPDLPAVLGSLVLGEAVPHLAALRYKPDGLEKYRTWQEVWELQRREDAGESVEIAAPPKYTSADFLRPEYSNARGPLDVPKERFILYPDVRREGDGSPVLGWAGWDHRDQALALGRELPVQESLGADDAALVPLVAGLVELEPWLHQWHAEEDPVFGASPAAVITQVIDQYLLRMEKTRADVTAWEPPAPTRGRRAKRA